MNGVTVGYVLLAQTFDDPENARIILLSAAGLVLLSALIAAGTVWWWRSSEVEHPALGPLEVMGSRSWWKGDYALRRRRLEEARPAGAEPAEPATTSLSEPVDLEAAALASPREFDDLLEFPMAAAKPPVEADADDESDADVVADADAGSERGRDAIEPTSAPNAEPHTDEPDIDEPDIDEPDIDEPDIDEPDIVEPDEPPNEPVAAVRRPIDPLLRLRHDE